MEKGQIFQVESEVTVSVNVEALKAALINSKAIKDAQIETETIDPSQLRLDDKFYVITCMPVDDSDRNDGNAIVYATTKEIVVETLAQPKPGFVTVNGIIDIPKRGSNNIKSSIFDIVFKDKNDAIAVCKTIAEIEGEKALKYQCKYEKIVAFLDKQIDEERFI